MKRFILTLQFLTKIPIKYNSGFDEEFHKGIIYFPLVGFVVGVITFLVGMLSQNIFPALVTAVLIVLAEVLLTGGLHIDGLGDTFDALYSYRDKEKMLEIMKDSRLGTNSLLAIVFLVILKIAFIYSFIEANMMWIVLFMPMVSRFAVIWITYKTESPREKGMGNVFIGKATLSMIITALLYSTVIIFVLGRWALMLNNFEIVGTLTSLAVLIIFVELFKRHVYSKIDGITGDILGCTIELSEVVYIIFLYVFLFL
ncbi:adenosylcobinamide-GDP ribazoletransferase [Metaclostridioides mangenotii]|uniref:adenosylcobinamide-GDP ribazoletransferase n=1 Tax=Metaclostridioides mangenotii TaxID=1540 RepID=UPI000489EA1B|nr:adenosylcobinamide-GDP ribazoletransferase [Clostridioides mangenotii]